MDRKKSKYLSETKFWAFGSLKAEKTRGGHNGPPHVDTSFQIPCGIGLIKELLDYQGRNKSKAKTLKERQNGQK